MTDAPTLFVARVGSSISKRTENRHIYARTDSNSYYEALCGSGNYANTVSASNGAALRQVHPDTFDIEADDLCSDCLETSVFEAGWTHIREDERDGDEGESKSRWERYQEWIDQHEWGNTKSPEDIQESGDVLVAPGYQNRDLDYDRKLHAYSRVEDSDSFVSKCGQTRTVVHSDELEGMAPSRFVARSDACDRCSERIDAEPKGSAATVDYDPFNVFDLGNSEHSDLPELPDEPDEYVCPDCGNSYGPDGIGQHWGHPKTDCEYPTPDSREQSLLIGLWLAGGSLEPNGTYPIIRKTSIRRYPLDWLKHELGVWGVNVSESKSSASQRENVEQGFDYTNAGSHTQYRLTTRTCPFLETLVGADIEDIELTPLAARVLFSFRGHVVDQSAITLRHPDGKGLVSLLHKSGFTETSLYEPSEGKNQWSVTLSAEDSRRFAEWIGGEPIPGITQSSKQLNFRERGPQGARPSRRTHPDDDDAETDLPVETVNLEPDWEWLGVCLAKLGHPELARRSFEEDLTPEEVYGGILDEVYANRSNLPKPAEI